MLTTIAGVLGGLVKDTVVTVGKVVDTITEEVSSIPEAFEQGYSNGILTAEETKEEYSDLDVKVSEPTRKFGQ
ncbi:MAG: hypothetical protein WC179_06915 [Candidatus Cloacimonadaceae bacterium]|jgi:hypothetical protein